LQKIGNLLKKGNYGCKLQGGRTSFLRPLTFRISEHNGQPCRTRKRKQLCPGYLAGGDGFTCRLSAEVFSAGYILTNQEEMKND